MTHSRSYRAFTRGSLMLALGGAMLLTACQSKPTGQVAAKVDGDEITTTELNAELQGVQVPKGADTKLLQRQALQRVIDRKLMANAARQENLDQSPEFIVRRQQLEDSLLAQMLGQKIARGLKAPTAADADKFMTDNPGTFAGRTIMTVDQIRFAAPPTDDFLKQLAAAHSMDQVVEVLNRLNIKFQRGTGQMDSAQLPPQALAQIRKLPPGEPFVVPAGNIILVSLITGTKPAPLGGDAVRPLAMNGVRNTLLGQALQQRLKTERAAAKIEYQPGFAPPPQNSGAGAAGATK